MGGSYVNRPRRELPFKVLEDVNTAVDKFYRKASLSALERIKQVMQTETGHSQYEQVVTSLTKALDLTNSPNYGIISLVVGDSVLWKSGVTKEWMPAKVVSTNGGIQVMREDGQVRRVTDMRDLRKSSGKAEGIVLEDSGVVIPEGTESYRIEKALDPITVAMNKTPLIVNRSTWLRNKGAMAERVLEAIEKCAQISGNPDFRPNSGKDCQVEFLEKRKLPVWRTTRGGGVSIDKDVLQHWADIGDDLAAAVIDARECLTKHSQLAAWEEFANAGLVQPTWNQYGQPQGRYSCDSPNLTNRITEIRETVEARQGYKFVSGDWGMAEYVTWASLSKDAGLSEIFTSGRDLHEEMGKTLVNMRPELESLGVPRKLGKTINFANLYKMLPGTLAGQLGVTYEQAQEVQMGFKTIAPTAAAYQKEILEKAAQNGYVETAFGRRRYCQDLGSLKGSAKHQMEKTMWHHHNAGTAAEMLKKKVVDLQAGLDESGLTRADAFVAMNMFDEIILEVRDDRVEMVKSILLDVMSAPEPGFLPFSVDVRVGQTWLQISK